MTSERQRRATTGRLRVTKRRVIVEDQCVRARDANTGALTHEQLLAVVILWEAPEAGTAAWIGWLTAMNHRSACFCAADLEDAPFRQWLTDLPGWMPERMACALASPGLHLVWRRLAD